MKEIRFYILYKERSQKLEVDLLQTSDYGLQIKKIVETESLALKVHSFN